MVGMPGRPTPHGENKAPGVELTRSGHADAVMAHSPRARASAS